MSIRRTVQTFVTLLGFAVASIGAGGSAVAVTPSAPETAADPADQTVTLRDGYVLGPGDVIEVTIAGREEYRAHVQVMVDGTIELPYVKAVPASNKTLLQLRDLIITKLKQGGFYVDPAVVVTVVTFASRYVTVLGEVGSPGLVSIDKSYHLSEILAKVGGARGTGGDKVVLTRASGEQLNLSVSRAASGEPGDDPYVNPGDKIFIAVAPSFYIYGQVGAPGSYKIERGMTLRKALARGGGLGQLGSEGRLRLFRDGKEMKKPNLDMLIQDGDTLVADQRLF